MAQNKFSGLLADLVTKAKSGREKDIDFIMHHLNGESDFAMTRFVDFALSLVQNDKGIEQIKHYLFNGSPIQRNYASLFFNRLHEWELIKEAYKKGLIDEVQAFAR